MIKEGDPFGIPQHSPGSKLDKGKVMASLLEDFSLALMEIAKVSTHGAEKYTRNGWESVEDGETRYNDAAWRHRLKRKHEEMDPDSGLLHEAHEAWNVLAKLELKLRRLK
jgi:hypothetical protein